MYSRSLTPDKIKTLLVEGPPCIAALTADVPRTDLYTPPNEREWSVNEVLAHLRSCADVWGDYIVTILNHDTPTFRAVNPTTWIKQTDYPQQDFQLSFQAFTEQRATLVALLESLAPEAWVRKAIVTGAGKPRERTVLSYTEWIAVHERSHLKQIERTVKTMRL